MTQTITDGTAVFKVLDKRMQALVDFFFPVGSIIARDDDTEPEILQYGKWEKIASNRVLQGAGGANRVGSDVSAGLPNIVGTQQAGAAVATCTGAIIQGPISHRMGTGRDNTQSADTWSFDASKSNAIYGASDTVQPPAHIVTFWKRIK